MNSFCTITTNGYLFKCLALYESILKHNGGNFHLWICTVDKTAYEVLMKCKLSHATIVDVQEIENDALFEAKNNRYKNEYCWTIKASFIKYVLNKNYLLDSILYLDSDTYFFSKPHTIFESLKYNDILLTCHNFTHGFYHLNKLKGKYNAGIVGFKNSRRALYLLDWWEKNCIKWCYNQVIPNKFADQKYLERIGDKCKRTAINKSFGVNTAMWNIDNKVVVKNGNEIFINDDLLLVYHFSSFSIINENEFDLWHCEYSKPDAKIIEYIYAPYAKSISNAMNLAKKLNIEIGEFLTDRLFNDKAFNHFILS